jgi:hypothetical protein
MNRLSPLWRSLRGQQHRMCSHIRSSAPSAIVVSRAAQTADLAKMSTALLLCGASFVAHSEARCNSPEDGVAAAQQKANFAAASSQSGVWVQDMKRSESLGPFLSGLGMPWFVSPFVDGIATTLRYFLFCRASSSAIHPLLSKTHLTFSFAAASACFYFTYAIPGCPALFISVSALVFTSHTTFLDVLPFLLVCRRVMRKGRMK